MDDSRTRITIGRRLLFVATDTRSMGVVLGVMTVTLLSSFVFGSRTRVVYPWTARAAAVDPVEALPSDDGFVSGAEVAAIEARDMRAEPPSVEAAEDGATALAPEIVMPDVVDRERNELLVAEAAEIARQAAADQEAELQRQAEVRQFQEAQAAEARAVEARAAEEAGVIAQLRAADEANAAARARTPDPTVTPDTDSTPDVASAPDVGPVTEALTVADTRLAIGDFDGASASVDRAEAALASIRSALDSARGGVLAQRVADTRVSINVGRLEHDIGDVIGKARVAQEAGDYTSAITVLGGLRNRAAGGTAEQQAQMRALLDLFRVSETIQELRDACQFERDFLGRTEPCEGR